MNNWRSFRAVFDHYRSRPKNITCPELNVTFTNDPPFDVLGVPECGDSVQPKLVLYLPNSDISCELRPDFLPNNDTSLCFEALRARTEVARLVFVIHGFLKSFSTIWLHEIKDDIQAVDANTAVIVSRSNQLVTKDTALHFLHSSLVGVMASGTSFLIGGLHPIPDTLVRSSSRVSFFVSRSSLFL